MPGFLTLSMGQCFSILGTSMTRFALTIWAWKVTGSATALALVGMFSFAPEVLLSPIAGVFVDRWNRKLTMMFSDLAAGLSTLAILILYLAGHLQIWHLYVAGVFTGCFSSFQFPAFSAGTTLMLPKEQYARASGVLSFIESSAMILAPLLAGMLMPRIGAGGIMVIDLFTLACAVSTLLFIHIPAAPMTEEPSRQSGFWSECLFGFRYILARPGLLGLQIGFFFSNLTFNFGATILAPMILSRTGDNSIVLGQVQSFGAIGSLLGGLFIGVWGGPKRKAFGVFTGMIFSSLGLALTGFGRGFAVWAAGMFLADFLGPMLNASNQAIWQSKVPPGIQGRVFSVRRLIAQLSGPLAMALAGPMADHLFEPAMMKGGSLAGLFGFAVGTGRGSGMALMLVIGGLLGMICASCGFLFKDIREVESILPDHDVESGTQGVAIS